MDFAPFLRSFQAGSEGDPIPVRGDGGMEGRLPEIRKLPLDRRLEAEIHVGEIAPRRWRR